MTNVASAVSNLSLLSALRTQSMSMEGAGIYFQSIRMAMSNEVHTGTAVHIVFSSNISSSL